MGKRRAPYLEPPARPLLQSLPPELLHNICEYLDERDVPSVRLTCSILASVGLDHFGGEVPLVFHRDKFNALLRIAEHPVLAKRMRSLNYACGRLTPTTPTQWELEPLGSGPQGPSPLNYHHHDTVFTKRDRRALRRVVDKVCSEAHARRSAVSSDDRWAAYEAFKNLYQDQEDLVAEHLDYRCLLGLFAGCNQIREITVVCGGELKRRLSASRTAFEACRKLPTGDLEWKDVGLRQVRSVVTAVANTGLVLDSLTLYDVSHRLFGQYKENPEDGLQIPHGMIDYFDVIGPLQRLRICFKTMTPSCDDPAAYLEQLNFIASEFRRAMKSGLLRIYLSAAQHLRVLKLSLPIYHSVVALQHPWQQIPAWADHYRYDLRLILGTTTFPHLYELTLGNCSVTPSYLHKLLLRHSSTLRRLTLSDMHLDTTHHPNYTWWHFFTHIGGQFPNLHKARLHGAFETDQGYELIFDSPGFESRRISPLRDLYENFILRGEGMPPQDSDLPDHTCYPWE